MFSNDDVGIREHEPTISMLPCDMLKFLRSPQIAINQDKIIAILCLDDADCVRSAGYSRQLCHRVFEVVIRHASQGPLIEIVASQRDVAAARVQVIE